MNREQAESYVQGLVERARKAQKTAEGFTQEKVDRLTKALAYGLTRENVKADLSKLALEESRLGDYESKLGKIEKKVKGIYRDIRFEKSVGVVEEFPGRGLRRIAKPVGVIAGLIPSTQPEMLPMTKALFAVKARDAIIFAPHPRGRKTTYATTEIMRAILKKNDAPEDLLLCCEEVSLEVTNALMEQCDLVVATGGAGMVKAAYSSGTPAFGVGAGNAQLLADDTADIADAAHKTMLSKTGDLAAGCSCDNSLVIFESIYDEMIAALKREGAYLCNAEEREKVREALFPEWPDNHVINRNIVASPVSNIAQLAGISLPEKTKFILVEETGSGPAYPFSGEKMSLILTIYKCKDLDDGIRIVNANLAYSGAGHSCGIHSRNEENILKFALSTYTSRCNVNLANSIANTGDWGVGYPFSGSLGCGTWGGNVTSENITLKHYLNNTWVASPIEAVIPTDEELFGDMN
ncbi:MAG: aldehyde dehydrogenase family protein [Clostridiales Family XIII bacterium]|jgi:sulfoacetaldehyde dehydrogenase|nr:aldehyde dehydrogenase family protein [Clostridiales Family XIII bacterium]